MFWFLVVPLIGSESGGEFCHEDLSQGVYGTCDGYDSGDTMLSFGGTADRGTLSNLNIFEKATDSKPAIFPCKVDKFGGKVVGVSLALPKFWKYKHEVKVYLKSGTDCSPGSTVDDEEPFCTLDMHSGEGTCATGTNVWVSDGVTEGAQSCVCVLLFCELSQDTWAATSAQVCQLSVQVSFNDPQTVPEVPVRYFGLPLWDTITCLFTAFELYLFGFPIYRLIRWLYLLGDFFKEWGRY